MSRRKKKYKLSDLYITSADDATYIECIEILTRKGFKFLEERKADHIHFLIFKMNHKDFILLNDEPVLKSKIL